MKSILILCLLFRSVIAIQWNKNWAFACDFKGNDLSNAVTSGEDCGGRCASTSGCTHFTWTKWQGGTCWMKRGGVTKADAFETNDSSMVCGLVEGPEPKKTGEPCDNPKECRSKWNYCGEGPEYCGEGCKNGPCGQSTGENSNSIIDSDTFACAFNSIDASSRNRHFDGLKATGWEPKNKDEAAVFLAHVYHETDGLKTVVEHCAPGCGHQYASSWCEIQGRPGKLYYGRGWFQLSWPCNYHKAGQSLGIDLLGDPDRVANDPKTAVDTALWFYKTNGMAEPAQRGDFAATTRIINGQLECANGSGYRSQLTRVETYKRIRQCFGLGEPAINPIC